MNLLNWGDNMPFLLSISGENTIKNEMQLYGLYYVNATEGQHLEEIIQKLKYLSKFIK